MPTEKNINYLEIDVLAAHLVGKTEDDENDDIEEAFLQKFDITLEQFENVMEALWPMLNFGISSITETAFVGFSNEKEPVWLIKKDISKQFVNGVVQWLGGTDSDIKKFVMALIREMEKNGKREFNISIRL